MKIGDELRAKWTEDFTDFVSKDSIYKVVEVTDIGFWILNDKGEKCFPISTTFTKIN